MKKILLRIGIILLSIILILVLFYICKKIQLAVPTNYESLVKTGGVIEKKYINRGEYKVSQKKVNTKESFKKYYIFYPSDIKKSSTKYPLVVIANGTGVRASKYKALFRHLASYGFIVIGNQDWSSWSGESSSLSLAYLLAENKNEKSIFYDKVDLDNIGITGHSQGGVAVFNAITKQKNKNLYKTAVALSPGSISFSKNFGWSYDVGKIKVPTMLVAGTVGAFETKVVIPVDELEELYEGIKQDKLMMRKTGYNHDEMLYQADGYVTAWFMWHLKGDSEAMKAFVGEDAEVLKNKLYQDQQVSIN